ncbi:hypothetical protein C1J02_18880 [Sulfitobacter sp. SK011]|nr:hypothetical protein C1J02_18880 [Sulfitobacter sp. SK011]
MREYDPATGRYIQADPLGLVDGASVYGYARQNPGVYSDFTGQCPYCVAVVGGAVAGVVTGYTIDQIWGDGCYTWDEAATDALLGAAFGSVGKAIGSVVKGGAGAVAPVVSRGPGTAIREAADAARAAGANSRDVGKAAHNALTDWIRKHKLGWRADQTVPGSGSRVRPDARSPRGNNIDLKPNTPSGRKSKAGTI